METSRIEVIPHPLYLEALFAFRSKVMKVFNEVLGLHELNHIAITQINNRQQILTFSSTPALEFNLFSSQLWRFDRSYAPSWFQACTQTEWQSLYLPSRYDELYYLKQIKHHYPLGYSLAATSGNSNLIYSMASKRACEPTRELFINRYDDLYKIGQYCTNRLKPLFNSYNDLQSTFQTEVDYEISD